MKCIAVLCLTLAVAMAAPQNDNVRYVNGVRVVDNTNGVRVVDNSDRVQVAEYAGQPKNADRFSPGNLPVQVEDPTVWNGNPQFQRPDICPAFVQNPHQPQYQPYKPPKYNNPLLRGGKPQN